MFFGHAHLKPPYVESYDAAVLLHQNKATQSVIRLFLQYCATVVHYWKAERIRNLFLIEQSEKV